ncbi:AT-rich interactive domain-containing protein 3B-like [Morone saxatilis]|uniref:AT-rich interactive domain-containing protein 3B-like n=1 Tax=Morone saxatilis TaxID=34816 RepID=UPI0015E1D6A8|nr:AT-rich interactive domain-containing protein 3B-like [Morone saxatilis]
MQFISAGGKKNKLDKDRLAMMDYSKAQMSSLSEEGSSQFNPAGVKLEVMMEHLQRQQGAKLEMNLQEKHLLQAQLLFAQHAAAVRASGSRLDSSLFGKADGQTYQAAQQALNRHLSRIDPDEEDEDSNEEEQEMVEPEENDDEDEDEEEENNMPHQQAKKPRLQQVAGFPFPPYSTSHSSVVKQMSESPPSAIKQEEEEKELLSPTGQQAFTSPNGFADWGYDEPFKQRGSAIWAEENDGGKVRGEPSRDFAKLYELDNDPQRKEFLDDLFVFMQKRGTPVNRIPIMAKQILDLYRLYKLVTEKGGLVEVINKKIWREITKGLNLPTSITSAAFTLRTQYMKYLYPFECEKKSLSSPGELQAAIDSNRREGRRPSYTNSLYRYSPSPSSAPHALLSSPTMQTPTGHNGLIPSASPNLKRKTEETSTPVLPSRLPMALTLSQQQQQLAQAATLEHLRERLERGAGGAATDGPDKKMMQLAEEQQRLMQQALQQNLLAFASQFNPMNLKHNNGHESKQDMSLSISTNGAASISVSVEVNGTIYSGMLFAQKSAATVASQAVTLAGTSGFSALSSSHSPSSSSSTSSKGPN